MSIIIWVILFSLVGGALSLIGGVILLFNEGWVKRNTLMITSWAAGVLLSVSFLDLFPEAMEMANEYGIKADHLFIWPFLAMVTFFVLERTVLWFHHHHEHESHVAPPTNMFLIIGDSLHNFIDGIVIATAFLLNITTGIVTAVAIAAHEIPQEIADFGIFLKSGMSKKKVFGINLLSSLLTLVGALLALRFAGTVKAVQPQLLAFAGGMFTYIAASDLIPELHTKKAAKSMWAQLFSFALGVTVMYGLWQFL